MATKLIGRVGIDTGTLYLGDPCYVPSKKSLDRSLHGQRAQWAAIKDHGQFSLGIMVETGIGDGIYPVTVETHDGHIASVTVTFLNEQGNPKC